MPAYNTQQSQTDGFQALRDAITAGDIESILAAIPEPPDFLSKIFSLEPADRDTILAGVFPALPTDEDKWETIEAAAMDSIVRSERGSLVAVMKYVPVDLLEDVRNLVMRHPDVSIRSKARAALDDRASQLGTTVTW